MKNAARNFGVDSLRILSMVGVVLLHVLGHGGILELYQSPAEFSILWFFEILAYPAVNCFILISGYVGYKEDKIFPKIKNILSLWFAVLFYSITIFFLFKLFGPEPLGIKDLIKSFMPTVMNRYWFFTAYFGVFLIIPVLNLIVYKSNFKQALIFIIAFVLFSIISVISDAFSLLGGYSVIWLAFMYLIGAIIKKYDLSELLSRRMWLMIALAAFAITWLSKIMLYFSRVPFLQNNSNRLIQYISPTIVLMAIGWLVIFSKMKSSCKRVISLFAPSTFSVYLIHENIYVREYFISNLHNIIGQVNFGVLVLLIIGSAIMVFLLCIFIDKIRIYLFRLMKIEKIAEHIELFIKAKINILDKKIKVRLKVPAE